MACHIVTGQYDDQGALLTCSDTAATATATAVCSALFIVVVVVVVVAFLCHDANDNDQIEMIDSMTWMVAVAVSSEAVMNQRNKRV